MFRTAGRAAGLLTALAILAAGPASGQLAPKSDAPILLDMVGKGDLDPQTCIDTLSGEIRLTQARSELRARRIRQFREKLPGGKCGDMVRIEAEGDVFYVAPQGEEADGRPLAFMRVRGDRAVYTAADDTIRMDGRVTTASDDGAVTESQRLSIKVSTQRVTIESEGSGRVRGVLTAPARPQSETERSPAAP